MATFKPVRILSSQVSTYPIANGQFIVTIDTGEQFLDVSDTSRILITDIIKITEAERVSLLTPINHFYYCTDSKQLYKYEDDWYIISPFSALSNITITPTNWTSKTLYIQSDLIFENSIIDIYYANEITSYVDSLSITYTQGNGYIKLSAEIEPTVDIAIDAILINNTNYFQSCSVSRTLE